MLIFLLILVLLILFVVIFMNQEKFGSNPGGKRLARIKKSPHYRENSFQNLHDTPSLTEGVTYFQAIRDILFHKSADRKPIKPLPSKKTDLLNLDMLDNVLVWFGHSSYFMQVDGKKILVDPVFSGSASPMPGGTKAFRGSDPYTVSDFPEIDILFLTHDHWDHMDYDTLLNFKSQVDKIICPLGVGSHLEFWGFQKSKIIERDWNREILLKDGFSVKTTPGRHFSGRNFKRNQTLWTSYVLHTPTLKIFLGGDSGYDTHFHEIGKAEGPFDLAILENGQYDKNWKYIHMQPEEVLRAAHDLKAKTLLPVHSCKFALANHSWYEPLERISSLSAAQNNTRLITPMIGEKVNLKNEEQQFEKWWQLVQ